LQRSSFVHSIVFAQLSCAQFSALNYRESELNIRRADTDACSNVDVAVPDDCRWYSRQRKFAAVRNKLVIRSGNASSGIVWRTRRIPRNSIHLLLCVACCDKYTNKSTCVRWNFSINNYHLIRWIILTRCAQRFRRIHGPFS
jgi:hypothetical protein